MILRFQLLGASTALRDASETRAVAAGLRRWSPQNRFAVQTLAVEIGGLAYLVNVSYC